MKSIIKKQVRVFIGWLIGMAFVLTGKRRRQLALYDDPNTILAVVGHNPAAKVLEQTLAWLLKKGFTFKPFSELIKAKNDPSIRKPRTAWLSFDDGWAGFEANLLSVLERFNVPATIFIAPHETERGLLWPNAVKGVMPEAQRQQLFSFSLQERESIIDPVFANCGKQGALIPKDEVIRLAHHRLIEIENHTNSHLSCAKRPVDEVKQEIVETQHILKDWTGKTPVSVCYPFGHFTKATDTCIKGLGLVPVHSTPGIMSYDALGKNRNMFRDDTSLTENIGRLLMAWPKIRSYGDGL